MRTFNILLIGGVVVSASVAAGAAPLDDADTWSDAAHSLQARITLVEKTKINGTRSLVPYLELRNVGDSASPLKVRCGSGHVIFELVDAHGKVVRDGWSLPRSGPHADPGTIVLPHDSSIRIGMYCSNWGVPKDAPAMVSTDSKVRPVLCDPPPRPSAGERLQRNDRDAQRTQRPRVSATRH